MQDVVPCHVTQSVPKITRKIETKWSYKNLKLLFDFWSVWRIKYVDIVWAEGEKYSKISLTVLRFWNMLICLSYLAWREISQEKHSVTNSAVYCVTTVFNKLSILGSKLSLALEERRVPMGVSLVLNWMGRAIVSQDKEAIEQFSPRCFPERHFPFPEWLTFPLKQMPGEGRWRSKADEEAKE